MDDPEYFYIPIISTNNIQGNYNQNEIIENNITYKVGGLTYLSRYIEILKDEFGKKRVIYLDAGEHYDLDDFNNSINIEKFFNYAGLNGTILNENDKNSIDTEDLLNKTNYTVLGYYNENYIIYNICLLNGDIIKIGVVGYNINKDLNYQLEKIIDEINLYIDKISKENEINAIILLTNLEIRCIVKDLSLDMYMNTTQLCDEYSMDNKTIFNVLKNISNIDAVILSNSYDNEIHHWEKGIPLMSSPSKGKYFNIMYLPFKKLSGKYILENTEIKIEGPLPICEQIFNDTQICDSDIPTDTNESIYFSWHGRKIISNLI